MADPTSTITYYQDQLLSQWVKSDKARATIGLTAQQLLCDLVPMDFSEAYNIATAVGPQLDVLGEYIGFSRRIIGSVDRDYFTLANYNDPTAVTGLTDWTDPLQNAGSNMFNYIFGEGSYSDLSDDEYRYLLQWKVVLNNTDATLYKITEFLYTFLGADASVWDNKDMTLVYYLPRGQLSTQVVQQNLLPRPMGVGLSYYVSDAPGTISGFGDYNSNLTPAWTGFPSYATGFNDWQWLNYEDQL